MSEKITIAKLARKDMPSKFKEGDTYKMTTILDNNKRRMTAFGRWAEGWNIGDEVEVNIKTKTWRDKDGFEQTSLNLDNPNKQPFVPRGGGGGGGAVNPMIGIYNSAVIFAVALAVSDAKKKLTLEDVDKIANHIKTKCDEGTTDNVEKKAEVPKVDVEKDQKRNSNDDLSDDLEDDKEPF